MSFPRKQKIHLLVKKVEPTKCKERLEKETDEDKTPKRATHEVPKEKDGIEKITYGAEVPTIDHVHKKYIKIHKKYQEKEVNHHKTLSYYTENTKKSFFFRHRFIQ